MTKIQKIRNLKSLLSRIELGLENQFAWLQDTKINIKELQDDRNMLSELLNELNNKKRKK